VLKIKGEPVAACWTGGVLHASFLISFIITVIH
jgi:hypothetical protein